jgi:amino acid adenylation domain-containing protein
MDPKPRKWSIWDAWRQKCIDRDDRDSISVWDSYLQSHSVSTEENNVEITDGVHISVEYLNWRVLCLKSYLEAAGLILQDRVAVLLPRNGYGSSVTASYLCCGLMGCVYIPLDPSTPSQRLQSILDAANPHLIISCQYLDDVASELSRSSGVPLLRIDQLWSHVTSFPLVISPSLPLPLCHPNLRKDHLAYIIFTSGSTGTSKGVMITHRGVLDYVRHQQRVFQWNPSSRILQFLPLCFDASLSEINVALLSGGICIFPPSQLDRSPGTLSFLVALESQQITSMCFPPAFLALMRKEWPHAPVTSLKSLVIGGECTPKRQIEHWMKILRIVNVYGPTECTVCSSTVVYDQATDASSIISASIGDPIPKTEFHLEQNLLEPERATQREGQLLIQSAGIALGYLHDPRLTAQKYTPDDMSSDAFGGRLYQTGDWVRLQSSPAVLEFTGRIDSQVKIRGLRVELQEIDRTLVDQFPSIVDSITVRFCSEIQAATTACFSPSAPVFDILGRI